MPEVVRPHNLGATVVFLDGVTGTGKTMLGPLMGSFERVELLRLEHVYEYMSTLHRLGKLSTDAAKSMISMYADIATYNTMIARETNFRPKDLSGVLSNPFPMRYFRRLFEKDGDAVVDRIRDGRPIVQVLTHQAMPSLGVAFEALGERIRVVEAVRHPLYLLEHGDTYIERHGTDARDYTIWIGHEGRALPWFAEGWEDKWAASRSLDKVIYSIDWIVREGGRTVQALDEEGRARIIEVPFEGFVLDPQPWVDKVAAHLGTTPTTTTAKVMKSQKVPRTLVASGPAKDIYRRYGWKEPERKATERSEYDARRSWAEEHASPEALEVLDGLCSDYERKWGLWF